MDEIHLLYEDPDTAVVYKPSGILTHPDGHSREVTVSDWVVEHFPEARSVGEPLRLSSGDRVDRPGIVHRLDRATSGVMITAKTQKGFDNLKKQFQERTIEKIYHACVYGYVKELEGIIDRPIGRSAKDFRLRSAQRGARGTVREARTEYVVLKRSAEASFLELRPHTGRPHQIRVHCKAINHPVVCDSLYAPKRECILGFSRLALHAHRVSFKTCEGEQNLVESPTPSDFVNAREYLGYKTS